MFGDHGLCGLPEEGAHGKSPKCLGGNLGDFGEFCKGLSLLEEDTHGKSPKYLSGSLGDLGNFVKIASPSKIMKGRHYPLATGVVGATGFPVKEARFAAW